MQHQKLAQLTEKIRKSTHFDGIHQEKWYGDFQWLCLFTGGVYGSSNVKCHVIYTPQLWEQFTVFIDFEKSNMASSWIGASLDVLPIANGCLFWFLRWKTETSRQKFTYFLQHELDATCSNDPLCSRIYWPPSLLLAHCWRLQQLCPLWYLVGYGKRQINVAKSAIHPQ